jgi:hypothetical protein
VPLSATMHPPAFALLLDTRRAVAGVLAECPRRSALSSQVLELAWRAKAIVCRECLTSVPLDGEVLQTLRGQAVEATAAIDRLTRVREQSAND